MPTYSIIIPVYRVERYLEDCLDSILSQGLPSGEYEVILIDDGSPDGSGAICDRYAARYDNFHVRHVPNGGVSRARNLGLEAAAGEYVLFCDADDLYAPGLFSALSPMLKDEPDMVSFWGRRFEDGEAQDIIRPEVRPEGETGAAFTARCLEAGSYPPPSVWLYLYRRRFLMERGLRFQPGVAVAEDMDFTLECLAAAASVTGTEQILYSYLIHEGSAIMTPSVKKVTDQLDIHIKWGRRYPCPATANACCRVLFNAAELGTREEIHPLEERYRKNRDLLKQVSGGRCRTARTLFRLLGLYNGSAVIMRLVRLHRSLD